MLKVHPTYVSQRNALKKRPQMNNEVFCLMHTIISSWNRQCCVLPLSWKNPTTVFRDQWRILTGRGSHISRLKLTTQYNFWFETFSSTISHMYHIYLLNYVFQTNILSRKILMFSIYWSATHIPKKVKKNGFYGGCAELADGEKSQWLNEPHKYFEIKYDL